MQDLSHLVPGVADGAAGLVPSAMDGGNMVSTNTIANPGAPGSVPITPMPEAPNMLDAQLPLPKLSGQRPVNPMLPRVLHAEQPATQPPDPAGGYGGVTIGSGTDKLGPWKLSPSAGGRS